MENESLDVKVRIPLVLRAKHLWIIGSGFVSGMAVIVAGWISIESQINAAKASALSAQTEIALARQNLKEVYYELRVIRCLLKQSNDYTLTKQVPNYRCEP